MKANFYDVDLQPASYNGVPFVVINSGLRAGRKNAIHEYPFRDIPYVEDLGRAGRRIQIIGFVLSNAQQTGASQRDAIVGAVEQPGGDTGVLIHPTLGRLKVNVLDFETEESMDEGGAYALRFVFMESGGLQFPSPLTSTYVTTLQQATGVDTNSAQSYVNRLRAYLEQGAAVVNGVVQTANSWTQQIADTIQDASSLYHALVALPGAAEGLFGRYFSGSLFRGIGSLYGNAGSRTTVNQNATVQSLIATAATNRENVSTASEDLLSLASGADPDAVANAAQAYAAAVLASAADPADGIRLLTDLAAFYPATLLTTAPIGASINGAIDATGDLFRRAAVVAAVRAALIYQPYSYDDAITVRDVVCVMLDAEIEVAGDQGEDDVFAQLRSLRAAVSLDFVTRGANLAPIKTFTINRSQPAPLLALRFYRDVTRSDELVSQVDPIHPLFMPARFKALAS